MYNELKHIRPDELQALIDNGYVYGEPLTQDEINGVLASRGYDETIHDLKIPSKPLLGYGAKPQATPITIPIIITGISGDLYHEPDFSKAACYQLTDVTVTGTVDIPDRFFAMPIKNIATGEHFFFGAQVTNGAFSVVVNFEKPVQYQYTNSEANLDLPTQEYNVLPMKFDVLRKVI